MEALQQQVDVLTVMVDQALEEVRPWKIVAVTAAVAFGASFAYAQFTHKVPFKKRLLKTVFRLARLLPPVRNKIQSEKAGIRKDMRKSLLEPCAHMDDVVKLPEKGIPRDALIKKTKEYLGLGEFDWTKGTQSGTVYNGNPELTEVMTEVYGLAAWTNPLHPDTFPGVRKMEAEVVRMACDLFHGSAQSCGTVTSGGTESIVLACKAYRDYAREVRGIANPVMVVPVTAHAAFDKAAAMLDIGITHVRVDDKTQKVDISAMRRAITRNTCMLVGSAPQFPHGSIDDIQAIAKLGKKYNIPVHVDACLGGFLICFMADAGYPLAPFDFQVDGVTSISADTHKYGYAPKGSSVILYSEPEYRHYQWFTVSDWPGGIYATSTISGSRAGGIIAACWAAMIHYGKDGYVECTRKIIQTTRHIAAGLRTVKGIKVIGDPMVSVVAIASDDFNIYALSDEMKKLGWNLNALQFPSSIHLACTMLHTQDGVADKFVNDIASICAKIMADPKAYEGGSAAIYGVAQSIPDRSLVDEITWIYLDTLYATNKD